MTLRVIPGGRGDATAPGLLVVGASEVVTMAGGLRTGSGQADVGRLPAADAGGAEAPGAPVVAAWEGRIVADRIRARTSNGRSRRRATRSGGSPGSTRSAAR